MKIPDFTKAYNIDKGEIARQIDLAGTEGPFSKNDLIKLIIQSIDLTSLEGNDTEEKIKAVCSKATCKDRKIPHVAAVCIYPVFVSLAKKQLKNTDIKTASVAGGFPSGQTTLKIKLDEVKYALEEGADEIDMVISRGSLLEGNYNKVFDEIAAIKALCKHAILKVILETGELGTLENIKRASDIALYAGADFIKTSTGKISINAAPEAVCIMLNCIKEFKNRTGKEAGIKPSGGISDFNTAVKYIRLTENILGKEWLNPAKFRFGASRLYDSVLKEAMGIPGSLKPGSGNY